MRQIIAILLAVCMLLPAAAMAEQEPAMTRGEFVQQLYTLSGMQEAEELQNTPAPFPDLPTGDLLTGMVNALVYNNVIETIAADAPEYDETYQFASGSAFLPNDPVTAPQANVMLARMMGVQQAGSYDAYLKLLPVELQFADGEPVTTGRWQEIENDIYDGRFNILLGYVMLPEGDTAPTGGIPVSISSGGQNHNSGGSGGGGGALFPGYPVDRVPRTYLQAMGTSGKYPVRKVVLPEGKSRVWVSGIPERRMSDVYFYVQVPPDSGYTCLTSIPGHRAAVDADFRLASRKITKLSGTVTLSGLNSTEDTTVHITSGPRQSNSGNYTATAVIPAGQQSASYEMTLYGTGETTLKLTVETDGWCEAYYTAGGQSAAVLAIDDNTPDMSGIDITTQPQTVISGTISLPDKLELDGPYEISVTAQSAENPHYILGNTTAPLDNDTRQTSYQLTVNQHPAKHAVVYYEIYSLAEERPEKEPYPFGHYGPKKTSARVKDAAVLPLDGTPHTGIDMMVIPAKKLKVSLKHPDGEDAEMTPYGNAFVQPAYADEQLRTFAANSEPEAVNAAISLLPDEEDVIGYRVFYAMGDDLLYYNENGTPAAQGGTLLPASTETVEMEVIPFDDYQLKVSAVQRDDGQPYTVADAGTQAFTVQLDNPLWIGQDYLLAAACYTDDNRLMEIQLQKGSILPEETKFLRFDAFSIPKQVPGTVRIFAWRPDDLYPYATVTTP